MTSFVSDFFDHVRTFVKEDDPIIDVSGRQYARESLKLLGDPQAEPLKVCTLTSLVALCFHDSTIRASSPLLIHVESPHSVAVLRELDANRRREELVRATFTSRWRPDTWMTLEDFNLHILTQCQDDGERAKLLAYTGTIVKEGIETQLDDGVTQSAVVSRRIKSEVERVRAPLEVNLTPYRSFSEAEQAKSPFVLRLKDSPHGIAAGIFTCDGGRWESIAMSNIAGWIETDRTMDAPEGPSIQVIW